MTSVSPKKIAWLLPSPIEGSGGHRTILNHARRMTEHGHRCTLYVDVNDLMPWQRGPDALKRLIETMFGAIDAEIVPGYDIHGRYDLMVATVWYSAAFVARSAAADRKAYFIQDYEACFQPMGDGYLMAEQSYRLGLTPVTIGSWLSHVMATKFASPARSFPFTADTAVYRDLGRTREAAVCFIHQPEKPRRCPAIGTAALGIVKRKRPDATVYTYGSSARPDLPFESTHLGLLGLDGCNDLYNRCAVGLCLSASNPSRVPFEMMAAGLPVVDFHGDNTIYDIPDGVALLAEKNPESVAEAILSLLNDDAARANMSAAGRRHMAGLPLHLELDESIEIFQSILDDRFSGRNSAGPLYRAGAVVGRSEPAPAERMPVAASAPPRPASLARRVLRVGKRRLRAAGFALLRG